MTNLEQRVWRLEQLSQLQAQQIASLLSDLAQLKQQQWTIPGGWGGGPSSSSGGFFVCMSPSTGTYAGTWSGSAPTGGSSFSATVYQVSGTGTITNLGTKTVVNWLPAALANSKACVLIPDDAGDYGVVSQSCV